MMFAFLLIYSCGRWHSINTAFNPPLNSVFYTIFNAIFYLVLYACLNTSGLKRGYAVQNVLRARVGASLYPLLYRRALDAIFRAGFNLVFKALRRPQRAAALLKRLLRLFAPLGSRLAPRLYPRVDFSIGECLGAKGAHPLCAEKRIGK